MKRDQALKAIERLVDAALKDGQPINIKLHFNNGDIRIASFAEDYKFLKHIGNSSDCPLNVYLDKFISTFKNAPIAKVESVKTGEKK